MNGSVQQKRCVRLSGVGLAEALVAMTILALAVSVALVLFHSARRSFKLGDNLTEQQQVVRIAFDEMTRELRQAGLNHNPDGDKRRPDEPIELAAASVIVFRADLDAADPGGSVEPEEKLAQPSPGAKFAAVSTGNDEIVAYALGNAESRETIRFDADVRPPVRDGEVESVRLENLVLHPNAPPYTLYRFVLDETGAALRTPVIDNVRSLRFLYYDGAGNLLAPPGGADDPGGSGRNARAAIRRIGIEIEGLTRDPQLGWDDPVDPVPGPQGRGQYRRFKLASDVTPRNLGMFGVEDLDAQASPPSTPAPPELYPGHCGGLWIDWAPNPLQDEVVRYELRYGTDPRNLAGLEYSTQSSIYLARLQDGAQYYVTVGAVDDSGDISHASAPSQATTSNENVPKAPTDLTATSGTESLQNEILLSWTAVTENEMDAGSGPRADPSWPGIRDLQAYRVHRGQSADFVPSPVNQIGQYSGTQKTDTEIVNCRTYYYKVAAKDLCGKTGRYATVAGQSTHDAAPAAPLNVQAHRQTVPWAGKIEIRWDRVVKDVHGHRIQIEGYKVQRAEGPTPLEFTTAALLEGQTTWVDPIDYLGAGAVVHYRVVAHDDCVNESLPSLPATASCSFDGDVTILEPADYHEIGVHDDSLSVRVDLTGGERTQDRLELKVVEVSSGVAVWTQRSHSLPPWIFEWDVRGIPAGAYRIDAVVEQSDNGCVEATSRFVSKF